MPVCGKSMLPAFLSLNDSVNFFSKMTFDLSAGSCHAASHLQKIK
jgi:hypothetical protein